jgi:hypothetical protein
MVQVEYPRFWKLISVVVHLFAPWSYQLREWDDGSHSWHWNCLLNQLLPVYASYHFCRLERPGLDIAGMHDFRSTGWPWYVASRDSLLTCPARISAHTRSRPAHTLVYTYTHLYPPPWIIQRLWFSRPPDPNWLWRKGGKPRAGYFFYPLRPTRYPTWLPTEFFKVMLQAASKFETVL